MPYVLGIDLGNTATSAAVARRDGDNWQPPSPVPLGQAGPTVPTMLCQVQDGSYVGGEAAQQQQAAHHEWVAGSFLDYVGDDLPLMVGSEFVPAHQLAALMIEWVADQVAHRYGHPAEHIVVAHSAAWGPHRTHLLYQALGQLGLADVTLVPEPIAVAVDYASSQQVPASGVLAVANLGGSGFDVTVLRKATDGAVATAQRGVDGRLDRINFDIVGSSLVTDHPSGAALDDVLYASVADELDSEISRLVTATTKDRAAALQLRHECVRAKEVLSYQPHTTVRADFASADTHWQMSRAGYEQLARPHLEGVPDLIQQAVQTASLAVEDLEAIVLAGGSSRTPLLRKLVAERLEQSPQVDGAPELVAAKGAASCAVQVLAAGTADPVAVEETSLLVRVEGSSGGELDGDFDEDLNVVDADEAPDPAAAPRPPVEVDPLDIEPVQQTRKWKILKLTLAAALIIFGLVMTFVQGIDSPFSGGVGILGQIGS